MKRFLHLFLVLTVVQNTSAQKQRVWIDTDIMIGQTGKDVDDGLALLMALDDTTISIEGISFVHGIDYAEKVTEKLLQWYAPDRKIETFKGARDSTFLGIPNNAVKAMIEALEQGSLTIVALGPATNVATLLILRPDLQSHISAISFCAGRKPGMVFNPGSGKVHFSDYNFDLDPKAAAILLKADVPLTLAGYDCSDSLFIRHDDYAGLRRTGHRSDRWLYRQLRSWENIWRVFIGSKKGFIPFDCATMGSLFHPSEFEFYRNLDAHIEIGKNDSGNLIKADQKPFLLVDSATEGVSVSYCYQTRIELKERLLKALHLE